MAPKANAEWWREKIASNRARDASSDAALQEAGYVVLRAWEHEDPAAVAEYVDALWHERTVRRPGHVGRPAQSSRSGQA